MGQSRVSPASYPTPSAGACEHDEVSGYTPSSISPLPDSLVVLCFTQTSTVMKEKMTMRRRITMATAIPAPMMTAVSTALEPKGGGEGEREEAEKAEEEEEREGRRRYGDTHSLL